MIAVFSFCSHDRPMALELARHIECLRGVQRHQCFIFHPAGVESDDIAKLCAEAFGEMRVVPYEERLKGWPDGPNQCFFEAAHYIREVGTKEPWLWLEADCVPTRPSWLDDIEGEYWLRSKPILGAFENTWDQGQIVGKHVTGVAVYPHDFIDIAPTLRSIMAATIQYRAWGACPPAFDCYLAPYTVPLCAEVQCMKHYWKSFGYREDKGQVLCQFKAEYGASPVVDMDAALIHGSKDFSLLDIVQSRLAVKSA